MELNLLQEMNDLVLKRDFVALAGHPGIYLQDNWAIEIANSRREKLKKLLAQNPSAIKMSEVVTTLAKDPSEEVRIRLAQSQPWEKDCEATTTLAQDPLQYVRQGLAENPHIAANCPETLAMLLADETVLVDISKSPAVNICSQPIRSHTSATPVF